MVTEKRISASSILGNNYYTYKLTSTNYTPSLNGSITVTCTCKDTYGGNVNGKQITLYLNGTSKGQKTTDSNGQATWSITCSSAGLQVFNIEDSILEVFVDNKADNGHTHTVSNITNFPTIPSDVSDLTDNSNTSFTPKSHTHGNLQTDGTILNANGTLNVGGIVATDNTTGQLVGYNTLQSFRIKDPYAHSNIGSSAEDTQQTINAKIDTALGNKQATLSSGTNIKKLSCNNNEYDLLSNPSTALNFKTVNGNSVIGTGDITVSGGSGDVSLACVSDMGLDDTDPTDVELFLDACSGKVITSISKSTSGLVDTYTITYNDSTTYQFTVTNGTNGTNGSDGVGITNIAKTSTNGLVDTYTITLSNGTTKTFTVTNGSNATVTVIDNLNSDSSTSVLSAKQGKALNTNKIETSAIATSFSSTTSDAKIPSEKLVKTELDKKITKSSTATGLLKDNGTVDTNTYLTTSSASSTYVAKENGKGLFSGSYSDLTSKPSYTPTVTSSTNGAYEIGKINISGSDVTIYGKDTDTHQSLTNYLQKTDVKDNLTSTDTDKPLSAKQGKELKTLVDGKQATLVSGTSIKTINNESLLGSGNISISGGGNITVDSSLNTLSTNAIQNQAVANEFDKLGSIDDLYDIYGELFAVREAYDTDDLLMMNYKLIYTSADDKLCYDKTSDVDSDELATMGDIPSLSNYVQKSNTNGLLKNDGTVMQSGTGASNYAVGNHTHNYASSSHNHNISDLNNTTTVAVTVTYTDNSTETINLLKYTGS